MFDSTTHDGGGFAPFSEDTLLSTSSDIDLKRQTMFFGAPRGLARFDKVRYSVFEKFTDEQQKNYWRPHDINLDQDKIDYRSLQPHVRHIFDKNIAYQAVLDSVASRVTIEAFLPWASLPEVEDCLRVWGYFEGIHNRAYQWIEQALHNDPSVFFDSIMRDTNIVARAKAVVKHYDEFINYSNKVKVFGYTAGTTVKPTDPAEGESRYEKLSLYEHKRLMYRAMVTIYALEAIRFYVSFSCTFAMGQQGIMTGNAKEMKLIQRDENLHVGISMNILRNWPREDEDFKKIAQEEREFVIALFDEVEAQEIEWAKYLFKDGVLLGINVNTTSQYIAHRKARYLNSIGIKTPLVKTPYSWMSKWVSGDKEQVAPQETEIDTYKVSALNKSSVQGSSADDIDF